ncbi:hypothetical protein Mrose_02179 [Calidithermus roseus]|uniref:Uncharacterized protein n=1 Tax=Calidithermus roseus TaxID=1644118 RepID=A0A399ENP2_9DEIN|nr:hypothetical protein Mrose_02179 [Calidithermus roseus]
MGNSSPAPPPVRILRNAETLWAELAQSLAAKEDWGSETASVEDLVRSNTLGDRAYVGTAVYCPSRSNLKHQTPWPRAIARLRKRIETSFSRLVRSFHLHVGQFKTFWSLRGRVNLKIAAHPGTLA